jgi:hypothetical protein
MQISANRTGRLQGYYLWEFCIKTIASLCDKCRNNGKNKNALAISMQQDYI